MGAGGATAPPLRVSGAGKLDIRRRADWMGLYLRAHVVSFSDRRFVAESIARSSVLATSTERGRVQLAKEVEGYCARKLRQARVPTPLDWLQSA